MQPASSMINQGTTFNFNRFVGTNKIDNCTNDIARQVLLHIALIAFKKNGIKITCHDISVIIISIYKKIVKSKANLIVFADQSTFARAKVAMSIHLGKHSNTSDLGYGSFEKVQKPPQGIVLIVSLPTFSL